MPHSDLFRALPRLTTERLLLRPIRTDDVEAIFAYCSDPEVTRYTLFETHRSIADTRSFVSQVMENSANGTSGVWGIELTNAGMLIGTAGFGAVDERHHHTELGYSFARDYWNRGLATEAARELIRFGLNEMRLLRIEARCHPDNAGSIRVLTKAGMEFEGRLRNAYIVHGRVTDALLYAIVANNR